MTRNSRFSLKTAQPGAEVAVLIDDKEGELEASAPPGADRDNAWH
ncbi:MAG: hypothetical protein U5N26_02985 [Candidatus Marinimicrobia bacterium]|nr:hypothetical protein [Candidatus Neomarinimicrobiota bacterium]